MPRLARDLRGLTVVTATLTLSRPRTNVLLRCVQLLLFVRGTSRYQVVVS